MWSEATLAAWQIGLPVAVITWVLLGRMFDDGELDPQGSLKTLEAELKDWQKGQETKQSAGFVQRKWIQYGGGFYGAAGLWTLVVVELQNLWGFVTNFPGFNSLFSGGVVNFLVSVFLEQIEMFVTAITWFLYWNTQSKFMWVWFVVAYLGFTLGMIAARKLPVFKRGV